MSKYYDKKRTNDADSEFEEKVLYINRTSKVVKGGRKFSFAALILVGDREGRVGYGFAKANEVSDAIRKGSDAARKNVCRLEMENGTIPHAVTVEWDGSKVLLKPAPDGTGIVAGSKVRSVLELAGVKNIIAKSLGSNNPYNLVKATFKAMAMLKNREMAFAERRT